MSLEQMFSTHEPVIGFFNEYRFLSNFYECTIIYEGLPYQSTEAAFQAAKTLDQDIRVMFTGFTPGVAKSEGRKLKLRPDWEEVKCDIMADLLREKFSIPSLRKMLLSTGDAHLEERNHWGDVFWGTTAEGVGKNILGKLLMRVRSEIEQQRV